MIDAGLPGGRSLEVGFLWDGRSLPRAQVVRFALERVDDALLVHVDAPLHGEPGPPPGPVGPTAGLWEYEVFELFVVGLAPAGEPVPYLEVELSPYGHHLVLQLRGVRQVERTLLPLALEVVRSPGRWRGLARIPWAYLPERPVRFNAYAIWGAGAGRTYAAMAPVPGDKPDFHRLAAFASWPFGAGLGR